MTKIKTMDVDSILNQWHEETEKGQDVSIVDLETFAKAFNESHRSAIKGSIINFTFVILLAVMVVISSQNTFDLILRGCMLAAALFFFFKDISIKRMLARQERSVTIVDYLSYRKQKYLQGHLMLKMSRFTLYPIIVASNIKDAFFNQTFQGNWLILSIILGPVISVAIILFLEKEIRNFALKAKSLE